MGRDKLWTINGVTETTIYWAAKCGIAGDSMYHYFERYDPETAVKKATEAGLTKSKRGTSGKYITYNGETLNLTEWGERIGIDRKTISKRLKSGYSIEEALSPNKKRVGKCNPSLGRRDLAEKKRNGQYDAWVSSIEKQLRNINGEAEKTYFRVRWCDRTSHSHSWRETMVERCDLQTFMDTHYLSKVVVGW